MSSSSLPSSNAAGDKEKMPLGQALKKIFKFLAWANILPAGVMAALSVFVLDVLTSLADYSGAGKVVMAILLLVVSFVISYFIVFVGEIVLGGGACVLYIAGNAILGGGNRTNRAETGTTSKRTEP